MILITLGTRPKFGFSAWWKLPGFCVIMMWNFAFNRFNYLLILLREGNLNRFLGLPKCKLMFSTIIFKNASVCQKMLQFCNSGNGSWLLIILNTILCCITKARWGRLLLHKRRIYVWWSSLIVHKKEYQWRY